MIDEFVSSKLVLRFHMVSFEIKEFFYAFEKRNENSNHWISEIWDPC